MSARDVLSMALAYAAAGWPVFPTRPDNPSCAGDGRCECKAPLTPNGFKDAATDPAVIRAWWCRWPHANVAIATGAPAVDVLDVDRKTDGDGFAAFNRLKRAGLLASGAKALVKTTSGGLHAYYAGTSQPCGRLPRHHLDFKAAGGYVLAPPSRVHGRPYELLDHRSGVHGRLNWPDVVKLLEPPRVRPARPVNSGGDITRLVEWVAARKEHDRNYPLFWAAKQAALGGALDAGAKEQFVDAALRAGLRGGEREARRTIASGERAAGKAAAR